MKGLCSYPPVLVELPSLYIHCVHAADLYVTQFFFQSLRTFRQAAQRAVWCVVFWLWGMLLGNFCGQLLETSQRKLSTSKEHGRGIGECPTTSTEHAADLPRVRTGKILFGTRPMFFWRQAWGCGGARPKRAGTLSH